jgi:hypothetical protein
MTFCPFWGGSGSLDATLQQLWPWLSTLNPWEVATTAWALAKLQRQERLWRKKYCGYRWCIHDHMLHLMGFNCLLCWFNWVFTGGL